MRILIVGTTYYPSLNGQSIFTVNLAEGLVKHGHQVTVLFPDGRTNSKWRNGVQLEAVGSIDLSFIHTDSFVPVFFGNEVRRIFDSFQPEIVHIQDHYPLSKLVLDQAKKRGIKVMGTNHFSPDNLTPYIPGASGLKPLYNRVLWNWMIQIYNRLDMVTAPSRSAVDLILKNGLTVPAFPLSCGADLTRFYPNPSLDRTACRLSYGLDPNKTIFLFVGRLDKEKKIDLWLEALSLIQRDDIQLAIAGNGAEMEELMALAKEFKLANRVRFINYVRNEEVNSLLNSADVFVLASESESLSIASLEAMACGLPLLLADAFALPDLVTPEINGYLFKPNNAEDAAHYMALLADHPERREAMGHASYEKAQLHDLRNTVLQYISLYEKLLVVPSTILDFNRLSI
jgi:glycosyltransferase involved in cell wall biosynthesis